MDLTPYVDDLQERLAAAADLGGDDARALARRLAAPLDAAVRLVLLEALAAAAAEISAELAPGSVDVRLRGGAPAFVVDVAVPTTAPAPAVGAGPVVPAAPALDAPPAGGEDEGTTTRTTLRLPDHLKAQVEVAATRDGLSVNSWLVRAVAGALGHPAAGATTTPAPTETRTSQRLTGWVR